MSCVTYSDQRGHYCRIPATLVEFPNWGAIVDSFRSYDQRLDTSSLCDSLQLDARVRDRMPQELDKLVTEMHVLLRHVSPSGVDLFSVKPGQLHEPPNPNSLESLLAHIATQMGPQFEEVSEDKELSPIELRVVDRYFVEWPVRYQTPYKVLFQCKEDEHGGPELFFTFDKGKFGMNGIIHMVGRPHRRPGFYFVEVEPERELFIERST